MNMVVENISKMAENIGFIFCKCLLTGKIDIFIQNVVLKVSLDFDYFLDKINNR